MSKLAQIFVAIAVFFAGSAFGEVPFKWTVLSGEEMTKQVRERFKGWPQDGYWTPSEEQIALLLGGLPEYLESTQVYNAREGSERLLPLERYTVQFIGATDMGRRFIWVNGYCSGSSEEEYPENWFVFAQGGGRCYFTTRYYLSNYSSIFINASR